MTKPLTERQQLARMRWTVESIEAAANLLIIVKNGRDDELADIAATYQRSLLNTARSLKLIHDQSERAMEERDGE